MGAPKTPAPGELKDADWLRREYLENCRSGPEIAQELGLRDASLVYRYLDRHKIPRRSRNWRRGFSASVEEGIKLTREADERHNRRPSVPVFMARVRAVISAKAEKDAISLRGALIDLAALVQVWAESIPFSPTLKPKGA